MRNIKNTRIYTKITTTEFENISKAIKDASDLLCGTRYASLNIDLRKACITQDGLEPWYEYTVEFGQELEER